MGANNIRRWVKHFKDGNTDIANQPRCCRQGIASTDRNNREIVELVRGNRRMSAYGVVDWNRARCGPGDVGGTLGMWKSWCSLVSPRMPERGAVKGDDLLHSTVTGDESCYLLYDPQSKRQNMG
jgi:hypothetical protein